MSNCKNCGLEIKEKGKIFCNHKCRDEYNIKIKYTITTCDYCDKEFSMETRFYRRWLNGKQKTKCCSRDCQNKLIGDNRKHKPKLGIDKVCPICNKTFYVKPYLVEQKKYCSQECLSKSHTIYFKCYYCGGKGETNAYQYNKFKRHFCSKLCKDNFMNKIFVKTDIGKNKIFVNGLKGYQTQLDKNKRNYTKPERILADWLNEHSIQFIPQNFMHDKFFVDFYIPDKDIVIEVFGDYWHGNPDFYGDNKDPLTKKQQLQQSRDRSRIGYLKSIHSKVIILWENEIINYTFEEELNNIIN